MKALWLSFRYSSTLPVRCFLAASAALWAILFAVVPDHTHPSPAYEFLINLAPNYVWAAIFAMDALLLVWRIFERRSRIGWTRFINAATCGMWALFIACTFESRGGITPDCADEIVMLFMAAWCTMRSDLTVNDRESA